jgi:hypothetical protein
LRNSGSSCCNERSALCLLTERSGRSDAPECILPPVSTAIFPGMSQSINSSQVCGTSRISSRRVLVRPPMTCMLKSGPESLPARQCSRSPQDAAGTSPCCGQDHAAVPDWAGDSCGHHRQVLATLPTAGALSMGTRLLACMTANALPACAPQATLWASSDRHQLRLHYAS